LPQPSRSLESTLLICGLTIAPPCGRAIDRNNRTGYHNPLPMEESRYMPQFRWGRLVPFLLVICASPANATPLPPGGTVSGSTAGNILSSYSGTVVAVTPFQQSTFFIPSTTSAPTIGFVSSAVVKTSQPGYDFVYQVNVSSGTVSNLSIDSFHNIVTDVSQIADRSVLASTNQFFPGNVSVDSYTRSGGTGDIINLVFSGGGVTAEKASFLVIVHTDSPTFAKSTAGITAGGMTIEVPTLAPVPEPATIVLWGGTIAGVAGFILRRRRITGLEAA
jgi:hypothetical protein